MKAFHNNEAIKKKYLQRVNLHIKADNLIRGTGWDGKKGCAVGCTLEAYNHNAYEAELGIPEWLARLEDTLFEGMSEEKSRTWPREFLKAIPVGADLEKVKAPFLIFVLERSLLRFDHENNPDVVQVINSVIDLYTIGEATIQDFQEAAAAAWVAAVAARTTRAFRATRAAAWAAEAAAEAAGAARTTAWAARAAVEYDAYANKLLELMSE